MTAPAHCLVPYPDSPVPNAAEGPLAGLAFAVKDIFDVAGYPTGCGNPHKLAESGIKTTHAPAVQRLLEAGARFAGKTVTDELAFSMNGKNAHFGTPRNGGDPRRIPGGSSSGSASAVSNGLCDFALGTDTGGSVRAPASHCGVIGLRPTHGRVSLDGCMKLAHGFDTCGWFARDLEVFARVGAVLLGEDAVTLPERPRLLLAEDLLPLTAPAVRDATGALLQHLGLQPEPVAAMGLPSDDLYWAFRHIQGLEAWQNQGEFLRRYDVQLGPGVKERFAWSSQLDEARVAPYREIRQAFTAHFDALLGSDAVLLMPTMPDVAPLLESPEADLEDYRNQSIRMLCLSVLSGCPQLSLPLLRIDGAPLGLSLVGPRGSDRSLIAFARHLMA
ncbi:amidase [Stutzerimonas azotifigens]|uniref:amidase n=1 Tax=Stutzerimonas azotifigens TaxID=291995 RepID=UPI00041CC9C8|nr:amidase [Stutzerimonas azotifigens]